MQKPKQLNAVKSEAVKRTISDIKRFLTNKNMSLFTSAALMEQKTKIMKKSDSLLSIDAKRRKLNG